jgi:hypothetical protein
VKTPDLPDPSDVVSLLAGRSVSFMVTFGFTPRSTP